MVKQSDFRTELQAEDAKGDTQAISEGLRVLARVIAKAILADTRKGDIGQIPEKRKFENLP